jgi:hypothetical protein
MVLVANSVRCLKLDTLVSACLRVSVCKKVGVGANRVGSMVLVTTMCAFGSRVPQGCLFKHHVSETANYFARVYSRAGALHLNF